MTGVAVVGTGFGCYTHVRALRAAGFDVLALVGRDPEKTAERSRLFEVPRPLTSLTEALAVPGVGGDAWNCGGTTPFCGDEPLPL